MFVIRVLSKTTLSKLAQPEILVTVWGADSNLERGTDQPDFKWFKAFAAVEIRSLLFWNTAQCMLVVSYQPFRKNLSSLDP